MSMTTDELARALREIEIAEFTRDDGLEYETYDELPQELQGMYQRYAEAYQKYFDMERKTE